LKKVVLDTNALISGLLWDGNEATIIEKAEKGEIQQFISPKILKELEGILKREKFTKRLEEKEYTDEKAVIKIALIATLIEPNINISEIKEDPDDNRVLEYAVFAKVDFIISGDNHLLSLKRYSGIYIVTASEFIKKEITEQTK
jgi:putative PIN family toxin of toxin-antitoxin system